MGLNYSTCPGGPDPPISGSQGTAAFQFVLPGAKQQTVSCLQSGDKSKTVPDEYKGSSYCSLGDSGSKVQGVWTCTAKNVTYNNGQSTATYNYLCNNPEQLVPVNNNWLPSANYVCQLAANNGPAYCNIISQVNLNGSCAGSTVPLVLSIDTQPTVETGVELIWTSYPQATSYSISRIDVSTGKQEFSQTSDTKFTDGSVEPGTSYQYQVTATVPGSSVSSNIVTANIPKKSDAGWIILGVILLILLIVIIFLLFRSKSGSSDKSDSRSGSSDKSDSRSGSSR